MQPGAAAGVGVRSSARMKRLILCAVVIACGGKTPSRAVERDPEELAARLAIARAEAQREGGVAELVRWADDPRPAIAAAARRGLGRVGGADALAALRARLDAASAAAIGIAGALDTIEAADAPAITAALLALGDDPIAIEALGRAGDATALPALTRWIGAAEPDVAAAAGIAMGRFGRRQLPLDAAATDAAAAPAADPDRAVRYAAVYALSRGEPDAARAIPALTAATRDADGEIRALALAGLARREAPGALAIPHLGDADWRVAVEAVRLATAPHAAPDDRHAVAAIAAREWARLAGGDAGRVHVLLEALRALLAHRDDPAIAGVFDAIATGAAGGADALAAAHARAIALAARGDLDGLRAIATLPDEVVGGLAAEVLDPPGLVAAAREGAPGRRGAAIGELDDAWADADAATRAAIVDALIAALGETRPDLAGNAADAVAAIVAALPADAAERTTLEAALVNRIASAGDDAELLSSLLGAAGAAKVAGAADACRAAHAAPNPSVRAAARGCLTAVTGADPGPGAGAPSPPPDGVDPAAVIGRAPRWTVETTRGTLVIELDGDQAPWHVATIARLAGDGFYDGLLFHRVVPDFVVQGGDPTGTGWGGPGFELPAEPSRAPYTRGAVGIADAGKDTGGSQWFVMHAHAPHLEGRYTVVGRVVEGDEVIDRLLVGDRIIRSRVAP